MGDGQIRWRNACGAQSSLWLPSFAKPADGRVQAKRRQSAVAVALAAHCQPGILEGPGKEAAARLIPPRPFAEAAEEVGHTGRSAQGCVLGFAGWGKSTSVVRAHRRACLAGDNFRMGAQQNALLRRPFPEMWLAEATSQASLFSSVLASHRPGLRFWAASLCKVQYGQCPLSTLRAPAGRKHWSPSLRVVVPSHPAWIIFTSLVADGAPKRGAGQHTGRHRGAPDARRLRHPAVDVPVRQNKPGPCQILQHWLRLKSCPVCFAFPVGKKASQYSTLRIHLHKLDLLHGTWSCAMCMVYSPAWAVRACACRLRGPARPGGGGAPTGATEHRTGATVGGQIAPTLHPAPFSGIASDQG